MRSLLPLWIVLLLAAPVLATNVRPGDPVYDYLQRCEIRGWLDQPLTGMQPYSRQDIARHLIAIQDHRDSFSPLDRDLFERYAFQYQDELAALDESAGSRYESFWGRQAWLPGWLYPNGLDFIHITGEDRAWAVAVNPVLLAESYERPATVIGEGKDRHTVLGTGASLRFLYARWSAHGAILDSHVSYSGDAADSLRFPYDAGPVSLNQKTFDFFDSRAGIAYQTDHLQLWFGHGEERWAGSQSGSLHLNDYAKAYTHFRARFRFRPFELSTVQARLQTSPPVVGEVHVFPGHVEQAQFTKKWMAAHRAEYFLGDKLRFGLFQQAFYGGREFDIEYLNPLMFVMATEYYNGDTDNMLIGADIRWLLLNRFALYGQVLFDEFTLSRLFSDYVTNKHAYLLGVDYIDPFGLSNGTLFADYARLRPYVYSHRYPINRATHLGAPLGFPLQPNSDQLTLGWKQVITPWLRSELRLRLMRHGANPPGENVGGDLELSEEEDGRLDNLTFLIGDREELRSIAVGITAEPVLNLELNLSVEMMQRSLDPSGGERIEESLTLLRLAAVWYPLL